MQDEDREITASNGMWQADGDVGVMVGVCVDVCV